MFKCGYVAIVGKPNAGKSSLINKLVGYKVAITTPKPQTTRFDIKGVVTNKTSQIIFIDTPGVHTPKYKLGKYMMEGVSNAIDMVDVIIYIVDATKYNLDDANKKIMENISKTNKKLILCINKIDKIEKTKILNIMNVYNQYITGLGAKFDDIIPISVYKNDGIELLLKQVENYLSEGDIIYPEDEFTDMTERQIVEETIREKILNNLDEEVPHGVNIMVETFKEIKNEKNEDLYDIDVNILCLKDSHKAIIIGSNGTMIKKIRKEAEKELSNILDVKINLNLWVKVRKNWRQDENFLKNIKPKI